MLPSVHITPLFLFLDFGGGANSFTGVTFDFSQGEDAGNYMCVATNDAGVVERSVKLTLQSKRLFVLCQLIRGSKYSSI